MLFGIFWSYFSLNYFYLRALLFICYYATRYWYDFLCSITHHSHAFLWLRASPVAPRLPLWLRVPPVAPPPLLWLRAPLLWLRALSCGSAPSPTASSSNSKVGKSWHVVEQIKNYLEDLVTCSGACWLLFIIWSTMFICLGTIVAQGRPCLFQEATYLLVVFITIWNKKCANCILSCYFHSSYLLVIELLFK